MKNLVKMNIRNRRKVKDGINNKVNMRRRLIQRLLIFKKERNETDLTNQHNKDGERNKIKQKYSGNKIKTKQKIKKNSTEDNHKIRTNNEKLLLE